MRVSAIAIATAACGSPGSPGVDGAPGTCDLDPLRTGLVAQQTGVNVDSFDCQILEWTNTYGEPDPMIFKAIMYVESRFDQLSVACPNLPCGMPSGWTDAESRCYGLMQIVPACGGTPDNVGLLANGHPNLEMNTGAADWPMSIFYPDVNTQVGIYGVHDNRMQVMQQFSGCTTEQYTLMAVGNYNSYGSTHSCSDYNTTYDTLVLDAYHMYASAAGYPEHPY